MYVHWPDTITTVRTQVCVFVVDLWTNQISHTNHNKQKQISLISLINIQAPGRRQHNNNLLHLWVRWGYEKKRPYCVRRHVHLYCVRRHVTFNDVRSRRYGQVLNELKSISFLITRVQELVQGR